MQRILGSLLAVAVLWIAGTALAQDGKDKVDIRGKITKAKATGLKDNLGTILVEGEKEKDTGYDKASIRITVKTKIEKLEGKERKPATFKDLKEGATVQATFVGPVAESYPVQATAGTVLILPGKDEK